jgi:DNA-damage-inducible protein J
LPFEPLIPNAKTIEAMKDARAGKLESFNAIDDLMANLNASDQHERHEDMRKKSAKIAG